MSLLALGEIPLDDVPTECAEEAEEAEHHPPPESFDLNDEAFDCGDALLDDGELGEEPAAAVASEGIVDPSNVVTDLLDLGIGHASLLMKKVEAYWVVSTAAVALLSRSTLTQKVSPALHSYVKDVMWSEVSSWLVASRM